MVHVARPRLVTLVGYVNVALAMVESLAGVAAAFALCLLGTLTLMSGFAIAFAMWAAGIAAVALAGLRLREALGVLEMRSSSRRLLALVALLQLGVHGALLYLVYGATEKAGLGSLALGAVDLATIAALLSPSVRRACTR